jgi:uncharacterized membrane protein
MRYFWVWSAILLVSAFAALLVTFAFPGSVIRPYVLFWFLLVCPGMALVRALGLSTHPAIAVTLATSLSIALDAIFAALLLYAHAWSPSLILLLIVCFTLVCVLVPLLLMVIRKGALKSLDDLEETLHKLPAVHRR